MSGVQKDRETQRSRRVRENSQPNAMPPRAAASRASTAAGPGPSSQRQQSSPNGMSNNNLLNPSNQQQNPTAASSARLSANALYFRNYAIGPQRPSPTVNTHNHPQLPEPATVITRSRHQPLHMIPLPPEQPQHQTQPPQQVPPQHQVHRDRVLPPTPLNHLQLPLPAEQAQPPQQQVQPQHQLQQQRDRVLPPTPLNQLQLPLPPEQPQQQVQHHQQVERQVQPQQHQVQPPQQQVQPQHRDRGLQSGIQQLKQPHNNSSGGGQLVRNLHVVELPFFDMIKVVLPMTELPSYSVPTRPGEGRYNCQFGLQPGDILTLFKLNNAANPPLPRLEVQMRVFLLETSQEQPDAFPPNATVRLDTFMVNLPPVIPSNDPKAEQKRYSRHVNLTPYLRPPRGKDNPHHVRFEWNGDKRAWAFTILLVNRLNSDILLDRMRKNPLFTRQFDSTKETIIRLLSGDEDDVQMDSLKISLIDPLTRTRIRIPARAVECTHLQCFDLYSYLMMNEKRPGWKCPVCDGNAIFSKLIIDEYFERILVKTVGTGVDEVELLKDGAWRLPQANQAVLLDSEEEADTPMDGDDSIMIMEKTAKGDRRKAAAAAADRPSSHQPAGKAATARPTAGDKDTDIICLSSDDNDEDQQQQQLSTAIAVSSMGGVQIGPGSQVKISSSSADAGTPNSSNGPGTGNGVKISSSAQQQCTSAAITTTSTSGAEGGGSGGGGAQQQNGHVNINTNGSAASTNFPLQTNNIGNQFKPAMDALIKTKVAQQLAVFLQGVQERNNKFPVHQPNSASDH